ncbi:hypothetical protein BD324DRAFT_637247 [Kockovaella imperatae]|uniref:Uncharacterized protein n=1 Tax=Kockovaella imperatae TaxID=4999 RepID=A0A1Y1U887_9TREE|nr:hypothetical protein BD324DRAFT_637247 [Kockovaella imperatae]ORX34251.1 hypothetical protein BD324DRAFT_637247 [Kockovaella imperatae]
MLSDSDSDEEDMERLYDYYKTYNEKITHAFHEQLDPIIEDELVGLPSVYLTPPTPEMLPVSPDDDSISQGQELLETPPSLTLEGTWRDASDSPSSSILPSPNPQSRIGLGLEMEESTAPSISLSKTDWADMDDDFPMVFPSSEYAPPTAEPHSALQPGLELELDRSSPTSVPASTICWADMDDDVPMVFPDSL